MLTRFVRLQLLIFTVASIIALAVMAISYIQVPTLLGIGRITVRLELPATGGLYRFGNVTYRGVQIGKVTAVSLKPGGIEATLSLDASPKIPANLDVRVDSMSAVGEQYVELRPRGNAGPVLRDGSVITATARALPQAVGPTLDKLSGLLESIPKDKLGALLDETFEGFNGAGYDLGSLFDSAATIGGRLNSVADQSKDLIGDSAPLLDTQAQAVNSIRRWAHAVAGITGTVRNDDRQLRALLREGPGAADEASRLFEQVKPTLPVLLANLTTLGQIGLTYHPALQQLLVLFPPAVAAGQSGLPNNTANGFTPIDAAVMLNDSPPCTVGFLPPSAWRSPSDTSEIDTPNGLYCKLPQDSPIGVRGARNFPCMGHPGKRAPTVEICESDKPYEPLAMHPHVFGAYPIDPNLIAQGIPPDDRTDFSTNEYGPKAGAAPQTGSSLDPSAPRPGPRQPPDAARVEKPASPPPPGVAPAPPVKVQPGTDAGTPTAAPSSYQGGASESARIATAQYNPRTGQYATPDGGIYRQSDLVAPPGTRTWKDLLLR